MIKSYDERDFDEAIKKKNLLKLKIILTEAINNDKTFSRSEIEEVITKLKKTNLQIFEEYKKLDIEETIDDESKWDEKYFVKLTIYLRKNFSLDRIPYIKKVGRKVFGTQQETLQPDKAKETEKDKVPFQQAPKQKKQSQNQSKNTQSNMNKNLAVTIGVGLGIVALVLIVAKLIK